MKFSSSRYSKSIGTLVLCITCLWVASVHAEAPGIEEIWELLQQQQRQIERLEEELQGSNRELEQAQQELSEQSEAQETRIARTETEVENTLSAIESRSFGSETSKTSIGGYGELHYNNLDNKEEIDLHRFVLFFSHQFSDELSFYSELEVEHSIAGDGKVGEVEMEQAFVQWDYAESHSAKGGVFLIPVGIMNQTHEPDTFYGVERNAVEKNIVPSTWWEGGVAFNGELAPGWSYDLAMHSGLNLDTDNGSASKRSSIRSARGKVGKAAANSFAYTGRVRFNGIPGIQWSTTFQYQSDLAQDDADNIGIGKISATLFESDISLNKGNFGLRALYSRWDIDDEIEILNAGSDEQVGWYLEPSYRFEKFGLFARFSRYDLTAGASSTSNEKEQMDFGINYWLHDNVVIKADYQIQNNDNGSDIDGFNLGFGYSF